ncbi:MAG: alginate export family protein [Verrucomicrobiae bacterium]|nr:alginate export family protein [Verrucomicrobiae bacterium]
MKTRLFRLTALWLFSALCDSSMGGDHSGKTLVLNDAVPELVDPTVDIRLRYEYGDQEGLDPSHAATMRNRLGLLTREFGGVQAFVEYEGTLAADRDAYNPGNGNGPANRTVIADPESHEMNQAWLSYAAPSEFFSIKAGRQGVNLDDQRYVGTVGWRQNMQTLDAAALTLKPAEDWTVYYGYVWQVNRIFGSEAVAPLSTDFQGQSHLFNAKYEGLAIGTLTTYAYLLDLHNEAGDTTSSNSYGLRLAGDWIAGSNYLLEYAHQTDGAQNPLDYSANYARAEVSRDLVEGLNASVGYEYLGSDNGVGYQFPLATLHKFNGYADRFVNTPAGGLTDLYSTVATTVAGGIKLAMSYHHFWDDDLDLSFGNEVDLVVSKALTERVTVLAKGAAFQGENGQPDVNRATLEVDIVY